ncbi:MAG: hypothetical protein GXP55_20870 [Deltaproteobacteria bacterium]|nr:hypothetical protein [Deltaproteobacteria bacterium]
MTAFTTQTTDSDGQRRAASGAALLIAVVAPLAYMLQRAFEVSIAHGATPNPALILRSTHAGFYWRAAIASWWAGLLAIAAWRWLRGREAQAWSVGLGRVALLWAILIPALALWLP